ncbi:glycosyltransferase [Gehongia tenuis]|uniref:Bifunctional glycosyltransferase family 2/GtrA family protein n=1 Tax=Gehongia tenuis TaxID=2763655 RepID=A0A926D4W5_9FIRM|nr:bifunctional glycosyltransferase family 2/GtrA family protein [Gehongia tenuis]MBC8531402.1 bifunctional glycosyltransferase family 2/GtrA family protein [Gehongia tenuis]
MNRLDDVIVIIPSLEPNLKLLDLLEQLQNVNLNNIIIVNDGSAPSFNHIFNVAQEKYNCLVLKHYVNMGKGRALKTAMNYVLNYFPGCIGVITVDSDGQHQIDDILICAKKLIDNPSELILGYRDFDSSNVPFRSKFGNKITRQIIKFLCGIKIQDTQTGLRGIPKDFMVALLDVKGERFEFEMNMLIEAKEKDISILEYPISTVYINENSSSHFNPLKDSAKIYSIFLKFIISSFSSFIVDIGLFSIIVNLIKPVSSYYIIISTVFARLVSSIVNFALNKNRVFKSQGATKYSAIKYYILCIFQLIASALAVDALYTLCAGKVSESIIKIVVDFILFLVSFQIQREWVFRKGK